MSYQTAKDSLKKLNNPQKAIVLNYYFQTKPGQYGAGDVFWGITVPQQRKIAQQFKDLSLNDLQKLLNSPVHELRFTGSLILVDQYLKNKQSQHLLDFYLKNIERFNNWDLVDLTAPKILGNYLVNNQNKKIVYQLANHSSLWAQRAVMVAQLTLVKSGEVQLALSLAKQYLNKDHDLLHKATGWVLREVGKQSQITLINFLNQHVSQMPRIMLRYSIEKLPYSLKNKYLQL